MKTHFPRVTPNPEVLRELSRHGDLSLVDKFARRVSVDPVSGCWVWIGGKDPAGYGVFTWHVAYQRKTSTESWKNIKACARAHRFSFAASHGWVPRELDHLACDRRDCVNPFHCVPTTTKENTLRSTNPMANNARKRVCKRGHELTQHPRNPNWRRCEICNAAANKLSKRRNYTRNYVRTSSRNMPPRKLAHFDKVPQQVPTRDQKLWRAEGRGR